MNRGKCSVAIATVAVLVLVIAVSLTATTPSYAKDNGICCGIYGAMTMMDGKGLDKLRSQLGLSEDQMCAIRGIWAAFKRDNCEDIKRLAALHKQLADIMREPGTCRVDDALAVWRDLVTVQDKLAQCWIRAMFATKAVLTLDQQRKLCDIIGKRMAKCPVPNCCPEPVPAAPACGSCGSCGSAPPPAPACGTCAPPPPPAPACGTCAPPPPPAPSCGSCPSTDGGCGTGGCELRPSY